MSKGSKRRPLVVTEEEFAANWDAIFARPKPQTIHLYATIESMPDLIRAAEAFKISKKPQQNRENQ